MPKYAAIVADASPLISLEKIPNGFSLLAYTCSKLLVPKAVADEVSVFLDEGVDYFEHHDVRRHVEVEIVPSREDSLQDDENPELKTLGAGERYAIALATARQVPLLLEERRARRLAREGGLRVFGAAATVKIAREEGGIPFERAGELLQALFKANRINRKVLERLLQALAH